LRNCPSPAIIIILLSFLKPQVGILPSFPPWKTEKQLLQKKAFPPAGAVSAYLEIDEGAIRDF
jgi:hypothetical protein